jgi:CBS domain containing-hemolysin-like protein
MSLDKPKDKPSDRTPEPKKSANFLNRLRHRLAGNKDLRESLEGMIESHAEVTGSPTMAADARSMLGNVINFQDLRVDDLMVPRVDIIAIEEGESLRALLDRFTEANHSRLPVYRETLDDVTGMIHVKDFLRWLNAKGRTSKSKSTAGLSLSTSELSSTIKQLTSVSRDVLFVPPSMPATDLLIKMKATHVHLAVVVDEYGGTDGLVSFEDIVEAIVGEISDEHDDDSEEILIKKQNDTTWIADARVAIATLDEMFGVDLLPPDQEDEADTLGGLVFEMAGRVPVRGEVITHACGIEFEIVESDARRVKRVRVHLKKDNAASTDASPTVGG